MLTNERFALWVFALNSQQDPQVMLEIESDLKEALIDWNSHGNPLQANLLCRDGIFLLVSTDHEASDVSGCAKDSLRHAVNQAIAKAGVSLAGVSDVFFQGEQGVVSCSRHEFVERVHSGQITAQTAVYDTTVENIVQYETGFLKDAGKSWHWQLVSNS